MSGLAGEVARMTSLQESTHNHRNSQSQSPGDSQRVVSGDGQVESRLADVSLHPMNRLTGSSSKEFGIKQLDDIWEGKGGSKHRRPAACVDQHFRETCNLKSSYLPK